MKLTDLHINDRQISEASKTAQADPVKAAAVNRQIRSLVPGQTIQGEVVSRNGSEVQIRLFEDMVLNARLDGNMNLEIGKNLTFEVRNNGKALTLSPLFANTAIDANALKALDMASLPVNADTVNMTKQLMDAGLPIDRNSLQQVFREINAFPEARVSDIVDLHRLSLPVNEGNVQQMYSYKNLTYQILTGMNNVMEELTNTMQGMVQSGNVEGAAGLYRELFLLAGELMPESEELILPGGELPEGMQLSGEGETLSEPLPGIVITEGFRAASQGEAARVQGESAARQDTMSRALSLLEEIAENGQSDTSGEEMTAVRILARELYQITGQPISRDISPSQLLQQAEQFLQKGMAEHDTGLLRGLLKSKGLQELLQANLKESWTLRPEDVADAKKVEDMYHRLDRQLRSLTQALERTGREEGTAFKAVSNMSQNLDFLQQINHIYTYVQLPLRLQQGDAHGDLYVYTNKKNLAAKDGKISALLHLDMEHLGPVDVYVALQNQKVSTQFYLQDDEMLSFLSGHIDRLTERLKKRGYDCDCRMQVRAGDEKADNGGSGGIHNLLAQSGHVPLAEYAFDVRA